MKTHNAERVFHKTYISDKNAKPLLGRLGGIEILIFLGSIILAVIGFSILTTQLGFTALPSLLVAGLPLSVFSALTHFVAGKPENYIRCWWEHHKLKKSNTPLLSATQTNEN